MTVPQTRPDDYDTFAWFYNRYWGGGPGSFTERVLPVLARLFFPLLPDHARILDLCCGTGQLAAALRRRGFAVTGVDGSAEMLRYARENAPGVEFIHADCRTFAAPGTYHGALSMYDSLNHIMTLEELTTVFRRVAAVLVPGGPFLFDLNMDEGYRARWRGSFGIVADDHVLVARSSYDPQTALAQTTVTMFRLDGERWRRTDLPLHQRCYAEAEVRAALAEAGFGEIAAYDATALDLEGHVGRMFFRALRGG